MPFSTPDGGTLESELQVLRRTEAHLLYVDPGVTWSDRIRHQLSCRRWITRVGNESVPVQAADQEFIAKRSCDVRQPWNAQRLNPVDVERVNILRVVGISEAATESGTHRLVLLADRYFMPQHVRREISLKEPSIGRLGNGTQRNCVLMIVRAQNRQARNRIDESLDREIHEMGNVQCQCGRVPGSRGCPVEFAAHIQRKAPGRCITARARIVV